MTTFESMHQDEIVGKLTTVDRVIFNGYLMSFFWPGYFQKFLCRQDVLLKDFGPYVLKATGAIKRNARQTAEDAGRPYRYFPNTVRKKDELAKRIAEEDGITEGLMDVRRGRRTPSSGAAGPEAPWRSTRRGRSSMPPR